MPLYPSNPLIEAVAKEGIRPVAFRHERGAVMAADGYGRVSDRKKTSVVAMQSQAGAENSLGGIAQANADLKESGEFKNKFVKTRYDYCK